MTDEVRTKQFERNAALEEFLLEINTAFETSEVFFMNKYESSDWPSCSLSVRPVAARPCYPNLR